MLNSLQATLAISGIRSRLLGDKVSSDHNMQIELPMAYSKADLAIVQKDCEILGSIFKAHPDKVVQLIQTATSNDRGKARKLANELGLTEEAFLEKEGGLIGLVIVIAIILLLATAEPAH